MPENDARSDGQAIPIVASVTPKRTAGHRSAITSRPEARLNGNSHVGRRTRDLFQAIMQRLDNPTDILTQADVLCLAELKVAAEASRKRLLEGQDQSANNTVRLENMIRRSEIRVGLAAGSTSSEQDSDDYRYGGLFVPADDDDAEPTQ